MFYYLAKNQVETLIIYSFPERIFEVSDSGLKEKTLQNKKLTIYPYNYQPRFLIPFYESVLS